MPSISPNMLLHRLAALNYPWMMVCICDCECMVSCNGLTSDLGCIPHVTPDFTSCLYRIDLCSISPHLINQPMLCVWYPVVLRSHTLISSYSWQGNRKPCWQPWACVPWRTQQGFCISRGHMVREVRRSLDAHNVRVWKRRASQAAQALPVLPFRACYGSTTSAVTHFPLTFWGCTEHPNSRSLKWSKDKRKRNRDLITT